MLNTKMIGSKIAEARKKINISQAQLAQRLFISSQAVGKWERGESMPDITTFNCLAEILGVDLNYFSSEATEVVGAVEQSAELPSGKEEKKLSWDMSSGNWEGADFSGLKNLHDKFTSSNLKRCKFIGSDMSGLLLKSNNIDSCDFSRADISSSHIQHSNLDNNLFKDSSLKAAEFSKSHFKDCDFSGADMSNGQMQRSSFDNNLFRKSSLKEATFSGSYINRCDLSGADLTGTAFKSGAFLNNIITNAVWNGTSFIGMQFDVIAFDGTMEDCYFENCLFKWVKFQNAVLTNTFFKNNTYKWIQFVDCKADRLTYEFLKSGQADVTGITVLA